MMIIKMMIMITTSKRIQTHGVQQFVSFLKTSRSRSMSTEY